MSTVYGSRFSAIALGAGILLAIAGCAGPSDNPTDTPSPTATATTTTPSATSTPTLTFAMPADCTTVLPAAVVDGFTAKGVILLAGPGGKYGDELITDPTPEMQAGGISCYFGVDNEDPTLLTIANLISVAPLSASTVEGVAASLTAQGLKKGEDEHGNVTYGLIGSNNAQAPATYNVLYTDAWISVISGKGGQAEMETNVALANAVYASVFH